MDDEKSEAASKKRGRPRAFAREYLAFMERSFDCRTERALHNNLYQLQAYRSLGIHPSGDPAILTRLKMLVDWPAANARKRGAIKAGVLTQLGLAAVEFGAETAREWAEAVNDAFANGDLKSVKDGERLVRHWRLQLRG